MAFAPNDYQKKNAKEVWDVLATFNYNEVSRAGVLGVIQLESYMNPGQSEFGGPGYGLTQWTPKSELYRQGALLGVSQAECETVKGQATIIAQGDKTGQWMSYANPVYGPEIITPMMLDTYKKLDKQDVATINFMGHFARPREWGNFATERKEAAKVYYQLFTGKPPTEGGGGDDGNGGSNTGSGIDIILDEAILWR